MKFILTAIALLTLSTFSFANIQVFWTANGAIIDDSERLGVAGPTALPSGSLFQLIWSPDSTAGALDVSNPTAPTGGDIVLNTFSTSGGIADKPQFVSTYGEAGDPGGALPSEGEGGFIYTRVFNSANPTIGDFYAQNTPAGPTVDATPDSGPAPTDFEAEITLGTDIEVDQLQGTNVLIVDRPIVVPEPGTLLMFALGSLLLIGFRRRR